MTASILNKDSSQKNNLNASVFSHANTLAAGELNRTSASSGGTLLLSTAGGGAKQGQRGNLSKGMYLQMNDLTEIMDQLNLDNDQEMKKIIDNGKFYNRLN